MNTSKDHYKSECDEEETRQESKYIKILAILMLPLLIYIAVLVPISFKPINDKIYLLYGIALILIAFFMPAVDKLLGL